MNNESKSLGAHFKIPQPCTLRSTSLFFIRFKVEINDMIKVEIIDILVVIYQVVY